MRLRHKAELLDRRRFKTHAEARITLSAFIEGFYNPRRQHSSFGYLSPAAFEDKFLDPGAYQSAAALAPVTQLLSQDESGLVGNINTARELQGR